MRTVLVDTAAWLALVNTRDELHNRAKNTMDELRRGNIALVTTEFVLLEVANALCAFAWREKAIKLIDGCDQCLIFTSWPLTLRCLQKDGSSTTIVRIRNGA